MIAVSCSSSYDGVADARIDVAGASLAGNESSEAVSIASSSDTERQSRDSAADARPDPLWQRKPAIAQARPTVTPQERTVDGRRIEDAASAPPPMIRASQYRSIFDSRSMRAHTDGPRSGVRLSDIRHL